MAIAVKNFPLFAPVTESLGDKLEKTCLAELSGVPAYNDCFGLHLGRTSNNSSVVICIRPSASQSHPLQHPLQNVQVGEIDHKLTAAGSGIPHGDRCAQLLGQRPLQPRLVGVVAG